MSEVQLVCPKCKGDKFQAFEGADESGYGYVYLKCASCGEHGGISANNYGDISTDLEARIDAEILEGHEE